MELNKITPEIREKLREPMPKEAISQHPTKKFLSTIKAIYVTERLNNIFGIGRWNLTHEVVKETDNYVLMKGKLTLLDYDCEIPEQYGGHTTTGVNTELADGYKSAVTDIQSKCASYLEIGIDVFKGIKEEDRPVAKPKPVNQFKELLRIKVAEASKGMQLDEPGFLDLIEAKSGIRLNSLKELDSPEKCKSILEMWVEVK
jgi:hypothetical protein